MIKKPMSWRDIRLVLPGVLMAMLCGFFSADAKALAIKEKKCTATTLSPVANKPSCKDFLTVYRIEVLDNSQFTWHVPDKDTYFYLGTSHGIGTPGFINKDAAGKLSTDTIGKSSLAPGFYWFGFWDINMSPGTYEITESHVVGEPHVMTVNDVPYDFQGAGEFVILRDRGGFELQTRIEPIASVAQPGVDPHSGLATCVSINTAVAPQVGKHRVTNQPDISGKPNSEGLQLRVDGKLVVPNPSGGKSWQWRSHHQDGDFWRAHDRVPDRSGV